MKLLFGTWNMKPQNRLIDLKMWTGTRNVRFQLHIWTRVIANIYAYDKLFSIPTCCYVMSDKQLKASDKDIQFTIKTKTKKNCTWSEAAISECLAFLFEKWQKEKRWSEVSPMNRMIGSNWKQTSYSQCHRRGLTCTSPYGSTCI